MALLDFETSSASSAFWDDADTVMIGPSDVSDFNPENLLPESDQTQASIINWLNPTQYDGDGSDYQAHLSSHLSGTGNWIFDSDVYRQWHDSEEHGILWIRGIPGAGKSVLASTLIRHLQKENIPVLYFFFRHTLDTNNTPEALLRDWLAQVLKYSPPLQHELCARDRRDPLTLNVSLDDLWCYLRRALMYLPNVYCVIDALDETDAERLKALVKSLDALGRWRPAKIKLAVTSRPVAIVQKAFYRGVKTLDIRLDNKRVEGDVTRYIQHRLDLSPLPPEGHLEVKNAIMTRADGLFLYAKLALDYLLRSDTHTLPNLAGMPIDLTKMYTNILIEHSRKTIGAPEGSQQFVLQLVTHATRPLRLLEIVDIVQFGQGQNGSKVTKDLIGSLCGPLIEVLPDETVRIVHHSVAEYLKGTVSALDDGARVFPIFDFGTTHLRLATACLSYLCSGCLVSVGYKKRYEVGGDVNYTEPGSLKPNQILPPFTKYAGSNWVVHLRRAASAGMDQTRSNEMLDSLLVEPNLDKIDVLINLRTDFKPTPLHFAIGLELDDYAKHLLTNKKLEYTKNGRLEDSLILYAARKENQRMVSLLLEHGALAGPRDRRGRTPLHLAVEGGFTKVATILLEAGVDPDIGRGRDDFFSMPGEREAPWTPLEHVFAHGSLEMATIFYQRLQSAEIVTKALFHAISYQNTPAIKLLLRHPKLDINASYKKSSLLFTACTHRDVSTIQILLDSGAVVKPIHRTLEEPKLTRYRAVPAFEDAELDNVDIESGIYPPNTVGQNEAEAEGAQAKRSSNVLHAWAREGGYFARRGKPEPSEDEAVKGIKLLIMHGADVNQVNEEGKSPLNLAHDAATVKTLLEGGADPNAVNAAGETLLHISYAEGIWDVLIPRADLNLQTRFTKRTPLLSTMIDGHVTAQARIDKAMRLIDSGADMTAVDKYGNSALHLAVGIDKLGEAGIPLIEKLCSSGIDVNQKNYQGKTPLHMNAPGSGRVDTIGSNWGEVNAQYLDILISAGADINARDSGGRTLLFQYVESGSYYPIDKKKACFDMLVHAGAKIDTLDSKGRSLLYAQVHNSHHDITMLEHMIELGVNPIQADHEGNTLLHEAAPALAKFGHVEGARSLIEKLIEIGIDPRNRNRLGRTPLHTIASINPGPFDPCNSTQGGRPTNADHLCGFDFYLSKCPDLMQVDDNKGVTPLHIASTFSEYMTRRLLEEGANPPIATEEGLTPFHLAARSRQANIIGTLLDKLRSVSSPDEVIAVLNAKDILNRTALYYAAASGRAESFQLLFDAGATLAHDTYAGSPWNGCADFEEELDNWRQMVVSDDRMFKRRDRNDVQYNAGGVMIFDKDRHQLLEDWPYTKVPFPSERLEEILEILGSNASKDQIGFIDEAIASAAEKGYDYTVECFLHKYKQLTGKSEEGLDDKTHACLNRRAEARSNFKLTSSKETLIHLMKSRQYEMVFNLLTEDSSLEQDGGNPSSKFVNQLAEGGFSKLIRRATSEEVISKTEWSSTVEEQKTLQYGSLKEPLLISACRSEAPNMAVVRTLLEEIKVNVNARHGRVYSNDGKLPNGHTALHYLAEGKHWWHVSQAIPYLAHHGADLDAMENENGLTPLGYALRTIRGPHFRKQTVETLLSLGASPDGADKRGNSYLSWTIDYPEIFELLLRHGAIGNRSVLAAAMQKADLDRVRMLLSNGADPNERRVGEERPATRTETSISAGRKDPESYEETYLLELVTATHFLGQNRDRQGDDEMFRMLLEYGADPLAPYARTTVLHRVMDQRGLNSYRNDNDYHLNLLLDRAGQRIDARDANGMTLLLIAAKREFWVTDEGVIEVMKKLIALGADIRARDNIGRSALHHACDYKKRCDFILSKAPDLLDSPDNEGRTPLQYILGFNPHRVNANFMLPGIRENARAFIAAGADVTYADHKGRTPLHLALNHSEWTIDATDTVGGPGRDIFDLLASKGADVTARTKTGEPPIFSYVRSSSISAVTDLSSLGPPPTGDERSTESGIYRANKASLEKAAAIRKEGLLWTFFEEHGVDLQAVNEAGEGILHLVAQDANHTQRTQYKARRVARFKELMRRGLDPGMEDKERRSPLDLAAALGREDILELFKQEGDETSGKGKAQLAR